ncbi:MAG: DNA alkylation repair protein [Planctomycetota bacterium]|jgi:3-methyladenine DNA glycosylase AlkD
MKYEEVMKELKSMGTAQNRKVYGRHGVGGKMFGVSYANLGKLKKKIKTDHELAKRLWKGGNHDARVLATMVADPEQIKSQELEAWSKDLDNYVLTDALASVAGRTAFAKSKLEKWSKSKNEWIGAAGWGLMAGYALYEKDAPDAYFEKHLKTIESDIHTRKNRVRHSMNMALIAMGMRNKKMEKQAIAAAKRIGKVEVDHGETGCKTPDAIAYIKKANARKRTK